jgi:mono/diheme cytochrome c family protein
MGITVLAWFRAPSSLEFAAKMERVGQNNVDLTCDTDRAVARRVTQSFGARFRLPLNRCCVTALAAGWLCAIQFCTPSARAEQERPDLGNAEVIALGKTRFHRSCFYCHGYEGSGGKAATLQRRADLTPELIFNTISNGRIRGSNIMPPWKNTLSEEEIWQLVAYILSLREMPEQK